LRRAIADRLSRAGTPLPAVLGDADGAAHAVVAAYDGVTTRLLLDRDAAGARAWLKQLLTALLTDGSAEPAAQRPGRRKGRSPWTPTSSSSERASRDWSRPTNRPAGAAGSPASTRRTPTTSAARPSGPSAG